MIIAHRGNLHGPDPKQENKVDYILAAINNGFDVEIDLWYVMDTWFLGHDVPQYPVDFQFINNYSTKLWVHAKNIDAYFRLLHQNAIFNHSLNAFVHDKDMFAVTTTDVLWTNSDLEDIKNSRNQTSYPIAYVSFELNQIDKEIIMYNNNVIQHICTDYAIKYKENLS